MKMIISERRNSFLNGNVKNCFFPMWEKNSNSNLTHVHVGFVLKNKFSDRNLNSYESAIGIWIPIESSFISVGKCEYPTENFFLYVKNYAPIGIYFLKVILSPDRCNTPIRKVVINPLKMAYHMTYLNFTDNAP